MNEEITNAIRILKQGGIVIFPTDTAFAIGCNVSDEKAVSRLFALRRRAETQAVPVLIDSIEMAKKYATDIPGDVIEKLINIYWPGALTIILPCKTEHVPLMIRGGGNTLGLRMPNNSIAQMIIQGVGEGIVGCSANFSGEKTPYAFEELNPELVNLVDYVVPGVITLKQTSTVIDCTVSPWNVLREGPVKI